MTTAVVPEAVAAPGSAARGRSFAPSVVKALVGRDLRRFFRQPSRVVGSFAQPLILWLVLGAGLGGSFQPGANAGGSSVSYLQYFYPGVVVLTMLFTAIFSTISVIEDRHHGFLQAVLAAPATRTALVLGKTLGGVTIAVLQAAVLIALAPLAGFSLAAIDWPVLLGALVLAAVGFTALGFAMAWWIDSTQGYHAVMMVALIPLWMLSGAMFPPAAGGVMSALMAADPMTYVMSAARRGFHGAGLPAGLVPGASGAVDLAIVAAFALVAVAAAVALCRRRA
ncbi:MAG TPA: ABC transporter permease [Polyangia bacterium]|nr:ABC transporter permease [Polyangia bacterium]